MVAGGLHMAEQHVCAHGLRHEVRGPHGLFQHVFAGTFGLGQAVVVAGIENADDIIHGAVADGEAGVGVIADDGLPLLLALLEPEHGDIDAVDGQLAHGQVVELEHVLDDLLLVVVDDTLFAGLVNGHTDLFLGDLGILLIGVHSQQAQDAVGGDGEEPDDGRKQGCDGIDDTGYGKCDALGVFHSDTLGDEFAADEGYVRQDEGNENNGDGVEGSRGDRDAEAGEPGAEAIGEVLSGEGGTEEAGEGDGDLDSGQEA